MSSTLWRSSRRYLLSHPLLFGLSVLGVALGVAMVLSIDLANSSARRAFELSAETVTGKATHQIHGPSEGFPDQVYRTLKVNQGVRDIAPVVEGYVRVPRFDGSVFQVLGIDPFSETPFRTFLSEDAGPRLSDFMTQAGAAILSENAAAEREITLMDTLRVLVDGETRVIRIAGFMAPADDRSARAIESLLVVDIATAQELFGMQSRLSRIDVLAPDTPKGESILARIEGALPPGLSISRSSSRTETVEQMARAFDLNLTALSLLALIVGMFLIYNTMTFSVVKRRTLIGQLRALGVTRRQIATMVLGEAAFIGVLGSIIGVLLGILLGQGLVRLVTQTINDLYYVVTVRDLAVTPFSLVKGLGLGLGATVLATLAPMLEAANAPVSTVLRRSQSESRLRAYLPWLATGGMLLEVIGTGLLLVPSRSIVISYLALLLVLLGFALLTPAAVVLLVRIFRPLMGRLFGILGRMAARGVVSTLSRTGVAVASLMIAIAAAVGVSIMVDSFRQTVQTWLSYTLQADVYIQPPSLVTRQADATLDSSLVGRLRQAPGVGSAGSVRRMQVMSSKGRTELVAIEARAGQAGTFRFRARDQEEVWNDFLQKEVVIISEPYSYHRGVSAGDSLWLQTDRGEQGFLVRGVYSDYGSDVGVVMMSRRTYERYYRDRGISGLSLNAAPGQDVDQLVARLRREAGEGQEVFVRSNRALRETSLEIFDRTFTITLVLRLLAVVVAFIGVLSSLMALQLERARELAVLRASGLTPRQVWRYVTLQTGLMGLMAGILSVPVGLVLAMVLTYVINKRSFGWTLQFEVSGAILLQALAVALVAAMLAGLYPSWKMSRANPALALRDE